VTGRPSYLVQYDGITERLCEPCYLALRKYVWGITHVWISGQDATPGVRCDGCKASISAPQTVSA